MGIQGLLPLLKSIMAPVHIKDLHGCSVAVDTYSWLHKGALSCSTELCKGISTTRHIDYCMHRVNLLRHYGIKPIMVFDGGLLPMKGDQENKRARSRKENLARAIEHEAEGNNTAAFECYQKAVDISPAIAYELIQVLKRENVCYVVAPYEADAQMTYMAISNQVQAVITEDSDLIPFGCPRIIFKMDKFGQGVQFQSSMLQRNKDLSFIGFSMQMVLEMCILSGCDYLQSLPGMGLKKAHALIKKYRSYDKAIKHIRFSNVSLPPQYEESFKKAKWTFQYQRVYNPITEDIVHLTDLPNGMDDDLDFLGPSMSQHVAKGVAVGDLDPFTKLPFQGENFDKTAGSQSAYKVNYFMPERGRRKLQLPIHRNLLTNYMKVGENDPAHMIGDFGKSNNSVLHSGHVMQRCRTLQKEQDWKEPILETGNKVHTETKKANVTSPYFHPKAVEKNDCEHMTNAVSGKDVPPTDQMFAGIDDLTNDRSDKGPSVGSSMDKCENSPCEGAFATPSVNATLPKFRASSISSMTENGKIVTTSLYFQPKGLSTSSHLKSEMKRLSETYSGFDAQTIKIPDYDSSQDELPAASSLKRKVPSEDNYQAGNGEWKKAATSPSQESIPAHDGAVLTETKPEEGKFGSNISHLDTYSEISKSSMGDIISSFAFKSSGSRASGLRRPLKDIRNNCTNINRSNAATKDISEYTYMSSKSMVALKSRKG